MVWDGRTDGRTDVLTRKKQIVMVLKVKLAIRWKSEGGATSKSLQKKYTPCQNSMWDELIEFSRASEGEMST
tara:strand:+ start:132 stop:347 length:216 start_codon:yes stop_codon:yes gene_type:complete